ncbi:unnamed protein product [Miscanthus lutarioriparius]|uniref:Protein kinase domain-containing protein n=1 Tax=Miscanthus lutarioriparius TaxID=422564 RepID=A0A811S8A3_9POAL|nr:unnamed protein product [Miscanthus lutarioriparius]
MPMQSTNRLQTRRMAWSSLTGNTKLLLVVVIVAATLFLEHTAAAADGTTAATRIRSMALPGCPDNCGDTVIPYPFGTKHGCFREGFNVTCDNNNQAAYLGWSAIRSLKVLGINLSQGEALVQKRITMWCINDTDVQSPSFKLMSPYLTGSSEMRLTSMNVIIHPFILVKKRKLAKDKERFFVENGGMILYQQSLSRQVETVTIFTLEVLKKATNNFDKSRELGKGGQGTVYKGILSDKKVVAVKRSKVINMSQKEEFVQEIIILSQINHKNVVRLLGCCLEVEVPILVPWRCQLVKSLNILLDENDMAKVADFGASRMLPKDAIQLMTMVQGTWGYLDPEYLQERKLTEKSDVYSFGVVLLELITRKKAIYSEGPEEGESLASSFLHAMKDNRVEGILDTSIMGEEMVELLQEVAELGRQCLSVKGEDRPSMAQVADKLKAVRTSWRELLLLKRYKSDVVIERSSVTSDVSPYVAFG